MKHINKGRRLLPEFWSGRRVSNSRPQPWQGCALPTELLPLRSVITICKNWSGRRVSNSRPQPWQGCALPTELLPLGVLQRTAPNYHLLHAAPVETGAGEESRTLDLNLGKVALYQLSYSRVQNNDYDRTLTFFQDRFTALQSLEREKSLELSTSTLARLRSTN
jgi:hypothetical protein